MQLTRALSAGGHPERSRFSGGERDLPRHEIRRSMIFPSRQTSTVVTAETMMLRSPSKREDHALKRFHLLGSRRTARLHAPRRQSLRARGRKAHPQHSPPHQPQRKKTKSSSSPTDVFTSPTIPSSQFFPPHCVKGTTGSELLPEALTDKIARVPNEVSGKIPDDISKYQQILLEKQTLNIFESHAMPTHW